MLLLYFFSGLDGCRYCLTSSVEKYKLENSTFTFFVEPAKTNNTFSGATN
jgi:hypothetical protein